MHVSPRQKKLVKKARPVEATGKGHKVLHVYHVAMLDQESPMHLLTRLFPRQIAQSSIKLSPGFQTGFQTAQVCPGRAEERPEIGVDLRHRSCAKRSPFWEGAG